MGLWSKILAWFRPIQIIQMPPDLKKPKPAPNELGDAIARIAEAEALAGVREHPKDSNRGPRVYEYQQATWLEGSGWPWCAAFVCWCVREAIGGAKVSFRRPLTAGAWDFERWADKEGVDIIRRPGAGAIMRGDILVYSFSHIGIATGPAYAGSIPVVEGNTNAAGSREGGGVYARSRDIAQVRSRIRLRV